VRKSAAVADQAGDAGARVDFDAASLARAVAGRLIRDSATPIRGGAVDSRRVAPGNAFFALPGERTDGHRFLADAARAGAAALVVTQDLDAGSYGDAAIIRVDDALVALHLAAVEWRNRFEPLVVGVTGSLAKTSTKEQIGEVLAERWNVLRNTANENNEIGLPLTMMRLGPEHEVAVLEMGMYQPGDIAVLAGLARPSIGVVTAVRSTHIARAGSLDEIERGKRELVEALTPGGTAILNADDSRVARMASHVNQGVDVVTYGFDEAANITATDVRSEGFDGMSFRLRAAGEEIPVRMPTLGRHGVHNALAAAAVALVAGLDLPAIARGFAREWHAPHRSTIIDLGPIKVLDDSYNAAPDSMIAALDLLASLPGTRKVAILGEMLELGETSQPEHRRVEEHARSSADQFVGVGPYSDPVAKEDLVENIDRYVHQGDVVLIKGSRGAAMDELIPVLEQAARRMAEFVA
jgi:UDP-N-acetylmuramoyl-tripeptide--D-alanyl-D-alanine ligase